MDSAFAVSKWNIMKYAIHLSIVAVWLFASRYAIACLEKDGYDILLCAILFVCGIMACAQAFLLLTEAEEIVCQ
jgi:hypothetical protein